MKQPTKPTASMIRDAATSGRRSKLYLWMLENFAEFSNTTQTAGRPNWQELSRVFGKAGLTDLKNKPPSPEATRLTWLKVRQQVAKTATRHRSAPKPPAPVAASRPVQKSEPKPSGNDDGGLSEVSKAWAAKSSKMPDPI